MAKKVKQYIVEVTRTSYSTKTFRVNATSIQEATDKALDEAGSYEFSEHDADYKATNVGVYDHPENVPADVDLTKE